MEPLIKNVMVYIDGSEQSVTAAQYAICLCRTTGASLYALYVINTRALDDLVRSKIFLFEEQQEYADDLASDSQKYLDMVKEMGDDKGIIVAPVCKKGAVYQEIISAIKEFAIDLLVLGELSRTPGRRDELCSDTERALRMSPCPVLIAKNTNRCNDDFTLGL